MAPDMSWRDHAACLGMDPSIFYPEKSGPNHTTYAKALRVCARCPVAAECLTEAMQTEGAFVRYGVWGGTTPRERQRLHAARRRRQERDG